MLDVRTFALGDMGTNAYLLTEEGKSECLVVDCGASPDSLIRIIRQSRLTPAGLLITHGHFDHIAGVEDFRQAFPGVKVGIHEREADFLTTPALNLSAYWTTPVSCHGAEELLAETASSSWGPWKIRIIHTPGHSPGSLVFYLEDERILFSGDLIFKDSVGRSDFPHSDPDELQESLKKILRILPEDTRIFPGHGPSTTLGREKKMNPFLVELQ